MSIFDHLKKAFPPRGSRGTASRRKQNLSFQGTAGERRGDEAAAGGGTHFTV